MRQPTRFHNWGCRVLKGLQHGWRLHHWRATVGSLGGVPRVGGSPMGEMGLLALGGVPLPGWPAVSPPGGDVTGWVYEEEPGDDGTHTEDQGEDGEDEFTEVDHPLHQEDHLEYLGTHPDRLATLTTPVGVGTRLVSYRRWGGLPPGGYTLGVSATWLSWTTPGEGHLHWGATGVDHPAWRWSTPYGVPRLLRRWGRVPPPGGELDPTPTPGVATPGPTGWPARGVTSTERILHGWFPHGGEQGYPSRGEHLEDYLGGVTLVGGPPGHGDEVVHPGGKPLPYRGAALGDYLGGGTRPFEVSPQGVPLMETGTEDLEGEDLTRVTPPPGHPPEGVTRVWVDPWGANETVDRYLGGDQPVRENDHPVEVAHGGEDLWEPEPADFPAWLLGAALAGAAPGGADRGLRLVGGAVSLEDPHGEAPWRSLNGLMTRSERQFSHLGGHLSHGGGGSGQYTPLVDLQWGGLDRTVHLRAWALTEVHLGEPAVGRRIWL